MDAILEPLDYLTLHSNHSTIQELPLDVLFQIFSELEVNHILALRQSCRLLEVATRDRSVWHQALSSRFLKRGLPVPGLRRDHTRDEDISKLTSSELEHLVIRAYRFWTNWTSSQPKSFSQTQLYPSRRTWSSSGSRNLAAEFLPGWRGRYLLTLTLFDSSASDRENRRYAFECWDLSLEHPQPIAELLVAGLLGYAINDVAGSRHVLAVTRREARTDRLITTTYTIDFTTPDTDPWFRRTSEFNSARTTLGLHGSHLIATDTDQEVRIMDVDSGRLLCSLKVPLIHADPTLRLPEHHCLEYEFVDGFVLTFCKQWIFLYYLSDLMSPAPGSASVTKSDDRAPRLEPIAKYKWRWRLDTISVNPRRHLGGSSAGPPNIDILMRFDTWYPWPVNLLHHFTLPANPAFSLSTFDPADESSFPYLTSSADGPFIVHQLASPVRLFTPSDLVLAPYGTALWLDASTDPTTLSQAGDHGQRIASKVLTLTALPSAGGRLRAGQNAHDDQVSPGLDPELASAMVLESDSRAARAGEAGREVSVLHVQETHELWSRLAVNEEEGQVAVGHVDGKVSVYYYAPPA